MPSSCARRPATRCRCLMVCRTKRRRVCRCPTRSPGTSWSSSRVALGDVVLIRAAGSVLGVAGIQIAKLLGARVLAAAGSDEKLERARSLGADAGINYSTSDLAQEVRRLTDGWGADVVFE